MATARALSRGVAPALSPKHLLRQRLLTSRRFTTSQTQPHQDALKSILKISPEVTAALAANRPVVALESTIYTHGAIGDDLNLEAIVRSHGAVPAVCGILAGVPTVGLSPAEVETMVREGAKKASRRDLAFLSARGGILGEKGGPHGGTTISGTMVLARLAGIRVFGTGGLGGVHRGGESSMDISADLTELGRTRVAVVSSGCKGFLDIPRTLEYLETQGVLVSTFADGKTGGVDFPAFWARDSGVPSPSTVSDEREAAAVILAQERLGIESGLLFANPIPEEFAIPRKEMEEAIETAVREADEKGFTGNANTPYVLGRIRELTQGRSVPANKALVQANVARAAKIAVELAKLMNGSPVTPVIKTSSSPATRERGNVAAAHKPEDSQPVDVLVAGSVAIDLSCDYVGGSGAAGGSSTAVSPALHTSNPSTISQSVGGVGHNIALAAHRVIGGEGKVRLYSMVGNDIAGSTILSTLQASGLDTSCVRRLGRGQHPSARTAQYVAVNDADKNLVMAMADMDIFSAHSYPDDWSATVAAAKPKWLVVDANWSEVGIRAWLRAGADHKARIAFEPVSAAKSRRLFAPVPSSQKAAAAARSVSGSASPRQRPLGVYPHASVDLCTPNQYELLAMYEAARQNGYLEHDQPWFEVLDAFGIVRGARDRFVDIASADIADAGIPVQSVNLLPYIPIIVTKLGARGALLTAVLGRDDPRLRDPAHARFVVSRSLNDHPHVGGVYMRLFPAAERVSDPASVNGIGDTFAGVLVAGLAMGGRLEEGLVDVAQRAAVMTLRSRESVGEEVARLRGDLRRAVEASLR
ncbi:Indigoidine synthase A like protein-domain-containing protein [Thermothelomyces heterothallicus CBS 202.75]|uniref:Indigoidine synthase A like protein-domain-containing protein n=1 Tax=Thermothelomyces heterothallicus CBS 202.75 TaxID=1149848 RepID=UPI00374457BC